MTDIDIDFADPAAALVGLRHVAAVLQNGCRSRHASGVYFQDIPVDPLDNMAVWDYKTAPEHGYFKFDFLANTIYQGVRDNAHLVALMQEPPWEVLDDRDVVAKLAHIHDYYDIVQMIQPKSVVDLAICIALPRPGKAHLIGQPRNVIDREIWTKSDQFCFKKAHAISYALSIVVQLNLLIEKAWCMGDQS